jgi:ABC-type transport system substrate-binding protein
LTAGLQLQPDERRGSQQERSDFPTYKENEAKGGYHVLMPEGSIGSSLAFNITNVDPKLRAVYGDLRFRQAVSHPINRDEMNEVSTSGWARRARRCRQTCRSRRRRTSAT